MSSDVCYLSAVRQLEMLDRKEISSRELVCAHLDRIKKVDGVVKAFLSIDEESALKSAEKADEIRAKGGDGKKLLGIPVAVKDNICVKGHACTCGSKILEGFRPPYNATVAERLLDSGAVIIGKTNMDEFAMGSSTEHSCFFPTHNPWDPARVPGGSSGGSAAAVAAGEVSLALGSDTGGSVRQPANYCGVVGFKPTYGLVSRYGLIPFASSLDQIGPMGREVADVALLLSVIAGKDDKDSTSVPAAGDYHKSLDRDVAGLRIGIPKEFIEGLDSEIKSRLDEASGIFRNKGAVISEVTLPHVGYAMPAYYVIAPAECSSNLARFDGARYGHRAEDAHDVLGMFKKTRKEGFGSEVKRRIMIGTYALSSGYFDAYYLKAQKVRTLIRQDYEKAFSECDVIMSPTTPVTAFRLGEKIDDPLSMYLTDLYTVSVNMAGLPGLVFQGGFVNGMPAGIQLIGKHLDEKTLIQLGHLFQMETAYHLQHPAL